MDEMYDYRVNIKSNPLRPLLIFEQKFARTDDMSAKVAWGTFYVHLVHLYCSTVYNQFWWLNPLIHLQGAAIKKDPLR